jgi:oligopeptide transport system substrate-binding protein
MHVLGAAVFVLLCCVPPFAAAKSKPTPTPTTTRSVTLRLAMPDASVAVDPALVADAQNVQFAGLLYSGLVKLDASYHVVKDAAASFSLSRDRRTYTFHLKSGLRFSNGDPVVAGDFKFGIQRSLNPSLKSPSAPTYLLDIKGAYPYLTGKAKSVSGIHVVDSRTLQITTRWPVPYFLMELTYPTSFALDYKRLKKLGATSTAWYGDPVGSGPYTLKSWAGDTITLVRNKYHQGPKPAIGKITISVAPLPTTNVYQFVSHAVDVVNLQTYSRSLVKQVGVRNTKMLAIDGVYMNMRKKPFDNVKLRRALTAAVDRNATLAKTLKDAVTPFSGSVPSGQPGYDGGLHPLKYDPSTATASLKAAGFPGGKHFPATTLYYVDDPAQAGLAKAIVAAWHKNLHITVATQALTLNTLVAKVQSGALPLYLFGWSADYPDPHDWLSLQWETDALDNNVGYQSARFDNLVKAADVTWNRSRRMQLYNQAQQVLVADAAWIPLYIPHQLVYVRPTVKNLRVTGYGIIPRGGNWSSVTVRPSPSRTSHG